MANSSSSTLEAPPNFGRKTCPETKSRRTSIGLCSSRPKPGRRIRLTACSASLSSTWRVSSNQPSIDRRPEESFAAGANVSIGKARTSAIFKKPTKDFEDAINKGRFTMTALPDFTPLQGGVPIIHEGQVIGAIGCSGAKSAQQDEEVAKAGAAVFESKQNK